MPDAALPRHVVRLADQSARRPIPVQLQPSATERQAIAADLGIVAVRKLRLDGLLRPEGRLDWRLEASLGATVVQECVATLEPVTTRIDETVLRTYAADVGEPGDVELEMPEDSIEPLPATLDLGAVLLEALALALPPYPRIDDAADVDVTVTEPGVEPIAGADLKPFAGLKSLRDKLDRENG